MYLSSVIREEIIGGEVILSIFSLCVTDSWANLKVYL